MNTQLSFQFYKFQIHFLLENQSLMVNATEMAKAFGKQVNEFLSNKNTKSFVDACLKNGNSRFLSVEKEDDLVLSRQKSGTWMHRILALKFAAWLDPEFELWVFNTIDEILFSHYRELEANLRQSAERRKRIEELESDLRSSDNFVELEQLKAAEKRAARKRSNFNKQQLDIFREALHQN